MKTDEPNRGPATLERPKQAAAEGCLTIEQAVARGDREACAAALERRNGLSHELALQVADSRIRLREAPRRRTYDRGFEQAITDGCLTIEQAVARGDRNACAAALERRNGLSHELALQVADNRIRLREAMQRSKPYAAPVSDTPDVGRHRRLGLVAVVLAALLATLYLGARNLNHQAKIGRELEQRSLAGLESDRAVEKPILETAKPASSAAPAFAVERDPWGNVTRVTAGRPAAVVEGLCRALSPSNSCWQSEVRETEPRHIGRRIGRFVGADLGQPFTVSIQRNRSTGRWFVGTGLRPITLITDAGRPIAAPVHPDAVSDES